jgi:cobalt-zinc-cadmium efflux system protein
MHTSHSHHILQGKTLYSTLTIAFLFMLIEIGGGIAANSLALYSDALHLLTDVGVLLLALFVLKITHLPRTPKMSYGYHRAEILGALANALFLWILCILLIYKAIDRFIHPQAVEGPIVFIIAAIGVIANIFMLYRLHPVQNHNLNLRATYLHILGDLLGSIGVLMSGIVLWIFQWNPIDPIITLLFTLAIMYSSGKIILESIKILMESTPEGVDPLAVEHDLKSISGVTEVHDLHIWSVSSTPQKTLNEAHLIIQQNHNIRHMTIQVEDPAHFQPKFCYDCEK